MVANYKTNKCEYIKILGLRIDNFTRNETEIWIRKALENPPEKKFVTTLNPEIALKAHRDKKYRDILNSADLNLCDGFGIKFLSWVKAGKIKSRYTGVDLVDCVLQLAREKNVSALIIVSKKSLSSPEEIERGIADKYNFRARAKYWNEEEFFEKEEMKKAGIVFVNFGAPEQENFIFENRQNFPEAKILAGVGGTFDFLTGKMKRAPGWMRKIGFEWLWRLFKEPKRIKRIKDAVIVFPWIFLTHKNN